MKPLYICKIVSYILVYSYLGSNAMASPVKRCNKTEDSFTNKPIVFYIAANGSSTNKGSKTHPFLSLEDAKKAIRQLKKNNKLHGGVTVWLREGVFELPESFSLQEEDSGTENGPVIFSAYPNEKVILSGGKKISSDKVKPISPGAAQLIVQKEAIPQIMEIDLAAQG